MKLSIVGNHCQGTQFCDGIDLLTPELTAAVDQIARGIPGFYFGRFDVRYRDRADFKAGKGLKIVELNGLTSEATHIYDPKHSICTAWKVLAAQWQIAFEIAEQNDAITAVSATELLSEVVTHTRV